MDQKNLMRLLNNVSHIIKHKREIELLKGERFNVFSILQMERAENKTHSAFLYELLNPDGSHLKGRLFLELFLNCVENKSIDLPSAKVKTEHYIGVRDDINKTGGRIDIYIEDRNGNSISIENKIDASDQNTQIERYCNHNRKNNVVYYLSKNGGNPSLESKGLLKSGIDFYLLSYQTDIVGWLNLCLKECFDTPILRETIKQYIILIKKITNTMDSIEEMELFRVILQNQEEASIIATNYNKAILSVYSKLREDIFNLLELSLADNFNLYKGNKVEATYSQIWIKIKNKNEEKIFFGIQGFSIDNGLKIGVFVMNGLYIEKYEVIGEKNSNYWIDLTGFDEYNGYSTDLKDKKTIYKLFSDSEFYSGFVNYIVEKSLKYIDVKKDIVNSFLE